MSFIHQFVIDDRLPMLNGHRVEGQCVLPGLAYVDLLYQSFSQQVHQVDRCVLKNLSIYSPLVLDEGQAAQIDLEWTQSAPDVWSVSVQGRLLPGESGMVRFAAAEMHVCDAVHPGVPLQEIDLSALRVTAHRIGDVAEHYARCRRHGLEHDEFMQAQGNVWRDDVALYAELNLSTAAQSSAAESMLHPALLDAAAVSLGLASQDEIGETQLFLPLFFDSFQAVQPLPTRCWVRVRRDSIRQRHDLRYLSLEFFDHDGKPLAHLVNLTAKLLRQSGLASGSAARPVQSVRHETATAGDPRKSAERFLCEQIGRLVSRSAAAIKTDVGYYELGLNSAYLMQIGVALSQKVGVDLPPTLMFEHPTIGELASHLADRFGDRFSDQPAGTAESKPAHAPSVKPTQLGMPHDHSDAHRMTEAERPRLQHVQEPIAIIGMEAVFPKAATLAELWPLLRDGVDCVSEVPSDRWPVDRDFSPEKGQFGKTYSKWGGFLDDVASFDPLLFGISPRDAQVMDPQARLFLQTVWTLLETGGHTRDSLQSTYRGRVGVYVGAMYQHYAPLEPAPEWDAVASLTSYSTIANRVSHYWGFSGPSMAIDTMCSSSAMAIHQACKDLATGECELAIAGGVNLSIHPKKFIGLSQAQLLASHAGSRSFSDGDGYLPCEGVSAVLLKPLAKALEDGDTILAVIKGSATLHAGRAQAYMAPNLAAQAEVIQRCLTRAGFSPADIGYVEAAANGSALGDPIEVAALARVWSRTPDAVCTLGAVKSNLGHPEAVSGMAQLAKVVLQLQHGQIAPLMAGPSLNPALRMTDTPFTLAHEVMPWARSSIDSSPRRALINSFAAGGTYACLAIEEAPHPMHSDSGQAEAAEAGEHIIICSAQSKERLRVVVQRLLDRVESADAPKLDDLAYTLQVGREPMPVRFAVVVRTKNQLIESLLEYLAQTTAEVNPAAQSSYYWADVDEAGPRLRQLLGEDQLVELVASLTDRQDWHRIAALWVQGAPVPWQDWPRAQGTRMQALPTYPFAREHYWLPGSEVIRSSHKGIPPGQSVTPVPVVVQSAKAASPSEQIEMCIAQFMQQATSVSADQFVVHRPLRDYGLDSITGMQLGRHLATQFGVHVTARAMLENPSAAALARYVASQIKSGKGPADEVNVTGGEAIKPQGRTDAGIAHATEQERDTDLVSALEQFQRGNLAINDIKSFIERSLTA